MKFHLDPEQYSAVTLPVDCHALVLAGAGSGKTRVLTHRIAYLMQQGMDQRKIVAITFTNKAAREMKERAEKLVQSQFGGYIGTFHAWAVRLLRGYGKMIDVPNDFVIVDSDDQMKLLQQALDAHFPDLAKDKKKIKKVFGYIMRMKERGLFYQEYQPQEWHEHEGYQAWKCYDDALKKHNALDFADLMRYAVKLLRTKPQVRSHLRRVIDVILVDEFQDTNPVQYELLRLLANDARHLDGAYLFCVGDDDQSIYGFRGALPSIMQQFHEEYGATLVKLERNYRSRPEIVQYANAVIEKNSTRIGKRLVAQRKENAKVHVLMANPFEEANYIAAQIKNMHEAGHKWSDFAVLYRANYQSRVLEQAFVRANIPHRVRGGFRFYERREIKLLLALLTLVVTPKQPLAVSRVLDELADGVGQKTIEKFLAHLSTADDWHHALCALPERQKKVVHHIFDTVDSIAARLPEMSFKEVVTTLIDSFDLRSRFVEEEGEEKGFERWQNMNELGNAVAQYAEEHPDQPIQEQITTFLQEALVTQDANERNDNTVSLMTVHASKGLEFPVVFLVGMKKGVFPHNFGDDEEERRLFYVAITRAQDELTVFFDDLEPSPYFFEYPEFHSIAEETAENLPY